jgi:hypothetical protein
MLSMPWQTEGVPSFPFAGMFRNLPFRAFL